jgi:hypothetical protein
MHAVFRGATSCAERILITRHDVVA